MRWRERHRYPMLLNCALDCIHAFSQMSGKMIITKTLDQGTLRMALEGRLDTTSSPELEEELNSSLDGVTGLVFDFSRLDYLSSAGLRVILSAHKRMSRQGFMKLCNVNDTVREIFEITGFSDFLTIE